MLKLAVVGKDVSRSISPQIHTFIAKQCGNDISYSQISIAEDMFAARIEGLFKELDGFNVTIPYKLAVIPYLNEVRGDAKIFGAVNTVACRARTGDNTDGLGFMMMLKNNGVEVSGKSCLLLGCGGAGRSVAKKLADGGARVSVYDVNGANAQNLGREFGVTPVKTLSPAPYDIIVNATGVGMHKTEGISPVGEDILSQCKTAVDLIYAPRKSAFLQLAEGLGKRTVNGSGMLFYQAYHSQCIWCDMRPDEAVALKLFNLFSKEFQL